MFVKIIRHAPPLSGGRLAGRTDVDADCRDIGQFTSLRKMIGKPGMVLCSPAQRCLQTAAALGFDHPETRPALWEQDYGAWENKPYTALPDLGPLSPQELAQYRPEGGESFADMASRVTTELWALRYDTLIIAHAGTVRAALSMATGTAALSFSVAPLSLTTLKRAGDAWSVEAVNHTAQTG